MAENALRPVTSAWINKIHKSYERKKEEFQDDADEAMRFFNGPYDWLYSGARGLHSRGFSMGAGEDDLPAPAFRMTVNKVAELVQLFGPALYHKNPVRTVTPRKPPLLPIQAFGDPNDQALQMGYQQMAMNVQQLRSSDMARAVLLESYLNYTPGALDLKTESRWSIDEALIKGRGILWTERYIPSGGTSQMIGSFFVSVDDIFVDPDAECLRGAKWIARRCCHPYWQVEKEYNLPQDSLRQGASLESFNRQAEVPILQDGDYRRRQGLTNDLLVYWKIYSKMGLGGKLSGIDPKLRAPLEAFGDFVYLVVTENNPNPLNVPQQMCDAILDEDPQMAAWGMQQVQPLIQWPTPFWADDAWPFTCIDFHPIPRKVWPMSHIKPGMGELKFLNWAYSFLAGKVRTASRDFIAIAKSAGEEVKDRIKHGADYTIIEIEQIHESIDKVVKFLQHPEFNGEIYKVIEGVTQNFERRTGLTELMYGLSVKQIRSAQEAQVKGEATNVRPDDMANKVEDAMSEVSRKEALACRWHLKGQDVLPVLGQVGAQWWDQFVTPSDPAEILHQLEYRVEAGSAKKPNKSLERDNMQTALQSLLPIFWQFAQQTGMTGPFNNLIGAWSKSIDLDGQGFMLPAPPPPPAPASGPGGPGGQGGDSKGQPPGKGE